MKKFICSVMIFVLAVVLVSGAYADDLPGVFPSFSSRSLEGDVVTNDVFSGEKLTMVNILTTWCPPCIGEMPDLGTLGRGMPKGSQLVGLVLDAEGPDDSNTKKNAQDILSKAKADFLQILPTEDMAPVTDWVEAIPTTIFVDSKGRIVGNPLVGARSEAEYRSEVEKILESM